MYVQRTCAYLEAVSLTALSNHVEYHHHLTSSDVCMCVSLSYLFMTIENLSFFNFLSWPRGNGGGGMLMYNTTKGKFLLYEQRKAFGRATVSYNRVVCVLNTSSCATVYCLFAVENKIKCCLPLDTHSEGGGEKNKQIQQ